MAGFALTFEVSTNETFLDRPPRLGHRMGRREPRRTHKSSRRAEARPQSHRGVDWRQGFRRVLLRAGGPEAVLLSPAQRALYYAHGNINGIDFWSEARVGRATQTARGRYYATEKELPKGRTVFKKLDEAEGGKDSGSLRAEFDLVGRDGKPIGSEIQAYRFSGDDSTRVIDCEFTTLADRRIAVKFEDTKEGTFAIRLVKALEEPTGHMLSSTGGSGEKAIWGKRADWVDYSGDVSGEELGIAIFDNPQNPKHPTYWHARGMGCLPSTHSASTISITIRPATEA